MKKPSLLLTNLSEKQTLSTWLIYHIGIVLFFLAVLLFSKNQIKIDSDLFNLIPKSFEMDSVRKADEKMTSVTGQNVFILVANPDFNKAKNIAVNIYEKLLPSENFLSLSLYNDMGSLEGVTDFLYKYLKEGG